MSQNVIYVGVDVDDECSGWRLGRLYEEFRTPKSPTAASIWRSQRWSRGPLGQSTPRPASAPPDRARRREFNMRPRWGATQNEGSRGNA